MITFQVYGVAVPKGNMKSFGFIAKNKQTGKPIISNKTGLPVVITTTHDGTKGVASWQQLVSEGASRALLAQHDGSRGPLCEGVRLTVAFYLPRPKKFLKKGAVPHLTKPDLDKLVRGVKDALTKVVWVDDSQVMELVARKDYARLDDAPHVDIRVEPAFGRQPVSVPAADEGPVLFPLEKVEGF